MKITPKAYLVLYLCRLETVLRESLNSEGILEDWLNVLGASTHVLSLTILSNLRLLRSL